MYQFASVALAVGLASGATGQLVITEVYAGLPGNDGTADWIELTNIGETATFSNLFYDDASASILAGGDLPEFTLAKNASVVILVSVDATDALAEIDRFVSVWGTGIPVLVADGGSLGTTDTAYILDELGDVVADFSFAPPLSNQLATIERIEDSQRNSVEGENGAVASNAFTNTSLGLPGDLAQLIGSPGSALSFVPSPGSGVLLGIAALAGARRRR
ncbi:MAG: hypothetical protein AAGI30_01875 [Planctomycetota bacterium]